MSRRKRKTVAEVIRNYPGPDKAIWHLYEKADPEAQFTRVRCGGGIMFPGEYRTVTEDEACPDCVARRVTL